MDRVSLTDFRRRLGAYLRKARAGETIVIVDRNRPIARLEPIRHRGTTDDRVDRLEAAGIVRRGRKPWRPDRLKAKADLPRSKHSVLAALLDSRRSSR